MATICETQRTDAELRAIAGALTATGGTVPRWLDAELASPLPRVSVAAGPDDYRRHMGAALSMGVLLLTFMACVETAGEFSFVRPKAATRVAAADPDGLEAIAMVQDWQPAGDEKPVLLRLAGAVRNPAYPRAWSAEKTDDDTYLVIFREPKGAAAYAFEVNLESEAVQATPEAVERLTMLRVRDEVETQDALAAREASSLLADTTVR